MFVGRGSLASSLAFYQALILEGDSALPVLVLVASLMEQRHVLLAAKDRAAMEGAAAGQPSAGLEAGGRYLLTRRQGQRRTSGHREQRPSRWPSRPRLHRLNCCCEHIICEAGRRPAP